MRLASRATDGRYDPTRLHELLAIGYTTSIDDPMRCTMLLDGPATGATIEDVLIDHVDSAVLLPAGIALDPGGIGKGLAADIVVTELLANGTAGALVSIGGDIAAAGASPTDVGWPVVVDDPWDQADRVRPSPSAPEESPPPAPGHAGGSPTAGNTTTSSIPPPGTTLAPISRPSP